MDSDTAMSILFDPEGFWPQAFHADARAFIEKNGTKEQREALGKETVVKQGQPQRLSSVIGENNFGNKRMGTII